jgi:hypothetical protein
MIEKVEPSFSTEYAKYLGYLDGREYGSKNPMRSFQDEANRAHPEREIAYREGLAIGVAESNQSGLGMRCLVHWDNLDNPDEFDTPCGCKATHTAVWDTGTHTHVFMVCDKHTRMAVALKNWAVTPISWES